MTENSCNNPTASLDDFQSRKGNANTQSEYATSSNLIADSSTGRISTEGETESNVANNVGDMNENHEIQGDLNDSPSKNVEQSGDDNMPSKSLQFPITRLKSIVKLVPSVHLVNAEAIAVLGKATEMFLRELAVEANRTTLESGKKTITMTHLEKTIQQCQKFEFLDGMLL